MSGLQGLFVILGVFGFAGFVVAFVHVSVHGMPVMRGRVRAWRIRRGWRIRVAERALEIQAEHPGIPFQCENWPRWQSLCGHCCAISRAEAALVKEQAAINEVIRATLR